MIDKELLELAAKAAGIDYYQLEGGVFVEVFVDGHAEWNPLTDDGDALRLAVKLGLTVSIDATNKETEVWRYVGSVNADILEAFKDDPYTATRLAIVLAAAEIGKGMK